MEVENNEEKVEKNKKIASGGKKIIEEVGSKKVAKRIFKTIGKIKKDNKKTKGNLKEGIIKAGLNKLNEQIKTIKNINKYEDLKKYQDMYFQEKDYAYVMDLVNAGWGESVKIAKDVLYVRIRDMKKEIKKNKEKLVKMIIANNKKEEELRDIELTKEEVEEALNIFESEIAENDIKTSAKEEDVNLENKVENFIREKEMVDFNYYSSESQTIVNEEISFSKESVASNSKYGKKNLENISKNVNEINNRVYDVLSSLQIGNNNKAILSLEELNDKNIPSLETQAKEFLNLVKEKSKDIKEGKELMCGMISTILILLKKVIDNKENIKKIGEVLKIDQENKINIAISGGKGKDIEEKEYMKNKRMNDLKLKNEYIDEKEWSKLSLYQKIVKRFKFKDFSQNPYIGIWEKFKMEDKVNFIRAKAKWREGRMKEIMNMEEGPKKIQFANNFSYYEWRDPNGYSITTFDIDNMEEYNKKFRNNDLVDKLRIYLNTNSNNRKVKGFIMKDGNSILNKGYAWFNNPFNNSRYLGRKINREKSKLAIDQWNKKN